MNEMFIREIAKMAAPVREKIGGFEFSGDKQIKLPLPSEVKVFSLTQLVSFIKMSKTDAPLIVNIKDEAHVEVFEKGLNVNGQRTDVAEANFSEMVDTFPFDQKMSQEDFAIKLMTMFVKDAERDELIKTVQSVRAEKVKTSDDDGISQTIATKAGVHLQAEKRVELVWNLKPFKTFPECEQPVVPHILRLHQRGDEMPLFALYDCDGGRWRVDATLAVRKYLQENLSTLANVAVL